MVWSKHFSRVNPEPSVALAFNNLLNLIFKHLIVFVHFVLSTKHSTWAVSPTLYESLSKTALTEVIPLSKKKKFLTCEPSSIVIFYLGLMLGRDTIIFALAIIGLSFFFVYESSIILALSLYFILKCDCWSMELPRYTKLGCNVAGSYMEKGKTCWPAAKNPC